VGCTEDPAVCPVGTACDAVVDEEQGAVCEPVSGVCHCEPAAEIRCHDDLLIQLDGCGRLEEVLEDCGGRGCVDAACWPQGTHQVASTCVPGSDEDVTGSDATLDVDGLNPDLPEALDGVADGDVSESDDGTAGADCAYAPSGRQASPGLLLLLLLGLLLLRGARARVA
jgi:hypothetical protein